MESARYPDLNWKFRVLTAEARIRSDAFTEALKVLEPEPPTSAPKEIFWRRALMQAYSLCYLKSYARAEERFKQVEAMQAESGSKAELAYIRGRCELTRESWDKAEGFFRSALDSAAPADPFLKTYVLLSLGWLATRDSRIEEAVAWHSEALATVETLQAPLLQEQALGNLASDYAELNDLPNTQKNAAAAEKIASQMKILPDEQRWLIDLGWAQQHQNQVGAAEESYKSALTIARQLKNTDVSARCLHNLTALKLYEGQTAAAEKYHQAASGLGLQGELLKYWQLDSAAIATAHADFAKAVAELQILLRQVDDEGSTGKNNVPYHVKWLIQSALARNYAAQGNAREAGKLFQESIKTVDEAAKHMRHKEFATAMRDNLPVYDDYLTFLIGQGQPAKALRIAQLGRARTLMEETDGPRRSDSDKTWLTKIQAHLSRSHAVLLSYFATDKECYLWTITGRSLHLVPLGISGPRLDILIDSYKREIQDHTPFNASLASRKLFQLLVQPAADLVPSGTHVIVVADSKIYSVNFETLISPREGDHYWIEDVDIQNASSIDLLLKPGPKRSAAKGLLLIGAPAQADPHFPELPNAEKEMASVSHNFSARDVTSIAGRNATPDSYTKASPGLYKYIHLATHGSANAMEPLQSAIILSADPGGNFKLLAQDIVAKKLHLNAELVTISACEGAGTNVQSLEGLLGLEWAFMRAGAHQVVAALWDVDDAVTPELMDDFYAQLKQGKPASEALRHAKMKMLKGGGKGATPYYWASLQLYTGS